MKKTLSPRQVFERSITEKDVVGAIRQLIEANGAFVDVIVERIPWGKTTSTPGFPDLVVTFPAGNRCLEGYYITTDLISGIDIPIHGSWPLTAFVEVKRPGGKHRPAQTRWIEERRRIGAVAFFASSVEEMVAGFKEFGIEIRGL